LSPSTTLCRSVTGFRNAQQTPPHKLLHLVEADGRGDLDRGHVAGGNRGDPTDPFRGPPPWRRYVVPLFAIVAGLFAGAAVLRSARAGAARAVPLLLGAAALAVLGASLLRRAPFCGPGTPGMAPYDGGPVRVVIRNISPA